MCKYVHVSVGRLFVCLRTTTTTTTKPATTTTTNTNSRKLVAAGGWRFRCRLHRGQTKTGAKQNGPENPLNSGPAGQPAPTAAVWPGRSQRSHLHLPAPPAPLHHVATCLHWRPTLRQQRLQRLQLGDINWCSFFFFLIYILRFSLAWIVGCLRNRSAFALAFASTSASLSMSVRPLATFVCHSHSTAADSRVPASVAATVCRWLSLWPGCVAL